MGCLAGDTEHCPCRSTSPAPHIRGLLGGTFHQLPVSLQPLLSLFTAVILCIG